MRLPTFLAVSAAALFNSLAPAAEPPPPVGQSRPLFDGKTLNGWMNSDRSKPRTPVEDGALNPHRAGHYMLVHTQMWDNFMLAVGVDKGTSTVLGLVAFGAIFLFVRVYGETEEP